MISFVNVFRNLQTLDMKPRESFRMVNMNRVFEWNLGASCKSLATCVAISQASLPSEMRMKAELNPPIFKNDLPKCSSYTASVLYNASVLRAMELQLK